MNERMKAGIYLTFPPSESCPPLLSFQVALETLLLKGPQKPPTHPLADYHYTGNWSVAARVVLAWLRPLRASQFPWQALPPGVLLGPAPALPEGPILSGGLGGCCSLVGSNLPLSTGSLMSSAWPEGGCQVGAAQVPQLSTPALESGNLGPTPALGKSLNQRKPQVAAPVKWGRS